MSGQLWIGSGFGDDGPRQGTIVAGAEGELGCSDVPGWNDVQIKSPSAVAAAKDVVKPVAGGKKNSKRGSDRLDSTNRAAASSFEYPGKHKELLNDGTDDHLHRMPESEGRKSAKEGQDSSGTNSKHADIQSIQEGAEIAGKVVLLSRGGCGFLEKVKWVQRRGGIALIVGDDTRGGPLIQMYARGDTSNVTIPSIFTSHTTAHLLSSLIPAGSYIEDTIDEGGNVAVKVQQSKKPKKVAKPSPKKQPKKTAASPQVPTSKPRQGWFSWFGSSDKSGNKDWIMVTEYKEEDDVVKGDPKANVVPVDPKKVSRPETAPAGDDDFVIGVQDWRDPDLVDPPTKGQVLKSSNGKVKSGKKPVVAHTPATTISKDTSLLAGHPPASSKDIDSTESKSGLLTRIFGDDQDESEASVLADYYADFDQVDADEHQGLWVTLAPTSAASPFFDTLLVLVVSPLITLTVVYALLILRSRIRRRRWRAPKSVVERLPVRTYQTIPPVTVQSRLPSPNSSSPATPLLQSTSRPRPRSRTTSGLPEPGVISRQNSDLLQPRVPSRNEHHEKIHSGGSGSEWKKYMGKQVECVVCLEEYIDGVSRVMSLPCGHEFHVDCM